METLHDRVAALCLRRFETLPKSGKPKNGEWTVLSCIVLESKGDMRVVALGTGLKCIGKGKMSSSGDVLNDSHAEVICRRSFLRFLYEQMKSGSDFLRFDVSTKRYSIADDVEFHFFTTHVPCGDASIFPKQNLEDFGKVVGDGRSEEYEIPRKIARIGDEGDMFRTGAKCLAEDEKQDLKEAGCGYYVLGAVRTKPGRGDPTLSVSCSDKLSRWCHLGLQGGLISLLLDRPVYLSSFTVVADTPFCKDALDRVLYDRLGTVDLKRPYHQRKLVVGQSRLRFDWGKDSDGRPSDCSICWCDVGDKSLEVAVEGKRQGVTKKNLSAPSSRLKICKLELFRSFLEVCDLRGVKLGLSRDIKTLSYGEVKNLPVDYNNCWEKLKESFKVWTTKDADLSHFFIK